MQLLDRQGLAGKYVVIPLVLVALVLGSLFYVIRHSGKGAMRRNHLLLSYTQALRDLDDGAYSFAIEHFTTVIEGGGRPEAWGFRGETYLQMKQYEKAKADFRAAIRREPGRPANFGGLAMALAAQGQNAEALKVVGKAIALARRTPDKKFEKVVPRTGDTLKELQTLRERFAAEVAGNGERREGRGE